MAAYKDLVGQKITVVTSNPPEPKTGQMWYNSTDGKLRGLGVTSAWRSSAPIIVARDAAGSAGTQSTATIFGGNINPGNTNSTDEYNGSGFSTGGTLNSARRQTSGCGLQTAGLCVGGYTTANAANVEEYNGTSWSEQNDIPGNYRNGSSFGTQTAALYVGGYSAPVPNSTSIQIYDGTNWTTSPATLGTGGNSLSSTGTSTAGLVFGGSNRLNVTEEWNGSAMSTGGNMSTSKYGRGSANQAPSENAMSAGGGIPAQTTVENYDGTSWSTLPSLAVATNSIKGAGTASSAMMMGGGPGAGPVFNTSTEFDQSTNTITAAAWASGGSLNTARRQSMGAGLQTAGIVAGGGSPSAVSVSESYDGTSFSEGNDLNTARYILSGAGTQTAALAFGGYTGSGNSADTEEYNGSSWSEQNNLSTARYNMFSAGTQTAALGSGGYVAPGGSQNSTEEYDGTSWTSGGNLGTGRYAGGGFGTQTAALVCAGLSYPGNTYRLQVEEYDGTSWTEVNDFPAQRLGLSSAGIQTDGLVFAGESVPGPDVTTTVGYDGTNWSSRPNMATARKNGQSGMGVGTSTAALIAGGRTTTDVATTEEFTGETETANVADFTTS